MPPSPPKPAGAAAEARDRNTSMAALGLGMQLAVGMALFTGLGLYADRRRGGGILFTLAGVAAGLGYGGYELWKLLRQIQREDPRGGRRD